MPSVNVNNHSIIRVIWDITSKCNLNCKHCYAATLQNEEELSFDEIHKVISNLSTYGVENLYFFGGEPLIRKDIFNIIEYCTECNINTFLSTNGLLFKDSLYELEKSGLKGVGISIESTYPHKYKQIRGLDAFNFVETAIESLSNSSIEHRALNCVIMEYNLDEMLDFIKMFEKYNLTSLNFDLIANGGNALENQTLCKQVSPNALLNELDKVFEYLFKNKHLIDKISFDILPPKALTYFSTKYNLDIKLSKVIHFNPYSCFYIDLKGRAYGCRALTDYFNYKECKEHIRGISLIDNSLENILQSDEFYNQYCLLGPKKIESGICKDCEYLYKECYPCPITSNDNISYDCSDYPKSLICEEILKL